MLNTSEETLWPEYNDLDIEERAAIDKSYGEGWGSDVRWEETIYKDASGNQITETRRENRVSRNVIIRNSEKNEVIHLDQEFSTYYTRTIDTKLLLINSRKKEI